MIESPAISSDLHADFQEILDRQGPVTALAPMQDVTNLEFMSLVTRCGDPDFYVTEYFRVHSSYNLNRDILRSITENPTRRPIVAQLIGNDIEGLIRAARQLQEYPVSAVDLNLGCPAPVVYKKCAGGGLLRDPARVDRILGALRDAIDIKFTVKTRIGFDSPKVFEEILPIFGRHSLDLLTVHGRTVKEMYRSEVHYDYIKAAVDTLPFPVLANGNVSSVPKAMEVLEITGAHGCMIGRGAIRNPWLFRQIKEHLQGKKVIQPTGQDLLSYIENLYQKMCTPDYKENAQVQRMKKFMNFIAQGIDPEERFLHEIRRTATKKDFFETCEKYLNHGNPLVF